MARTKSSKDKSIGSSEMREQVTSFKREKILKVATDLFFENGYQGTTLDMVADELGVTKPFIYYHFDSKAHILEELCRPFMYQVNAALDEALGTEGKMVARLHSAIIAVCCSTLENQRKTAIYFREEKYLSPEAKVNINKMRKAFDIKLTRLLEEGARQGEYDAPDPKFLGLAISGIINWAFVWYNPDGPLSKPQIAEKIADLSMRMIGATPPSRAQLS